MPCGGHLLVGARYRRFVPRKPRYVLGDGFHHVTTRGNRRQPIFVDDFDRERFLALLGQAVENEGWRCHAYCLMSNHFHLMIEAEREALSAGMWRLNGFYAQAFNRRHGLQGHLFERRFGAVAVQGNWHSLELSRYIVLNPVRARLRRDPRHWSWSSYRATLGLAPAPAWLTVDWLLGQFGTSADAARRAYRSFVADGIDRPPDTPPGDMSRGQAPGRGRNGHGHGRAAPQ